MTKKEKAAYDKARVDKNRDEINKRRRERYLLLNEVKKEKIRERARIHSKENKEKKTLQKRENRKKNSERTKTVNEKWVKNNRESVLKSKRKYNKSPTGLQKARDRGRAIRCLKKVDKEALKEISKWELQIKGNLFYPCIYCLEETPIKNIEIDHFYPLSRGGSHCKNNLVASCASCNNKKGCKNPFDFIRERVSSGKIFQTLQTSYNR